MKDKFIATSRRLLNNTKFSTHRYLFDAFNTTSRMTGLVGPRGTGKTTLMLQYINEKMENSHQCIYFSLDNIFFTQTKLIEFIDDLYEIDGIRYFFIDEVHKYPHWNQELKNIYDSFPDVFIVFSGSSSMDLVKGTYDLSRRGILYKLEGMSFREYLEFRLNRPVPAVSFDELVHDPVDFADQLSGINRLKGHFIDYLAFGYYPFLFEDEAHYHQKLLNIIDKTIYEDIPNVYKLKTENLIFFKKILSYMATIPPGELNRNSIAKHIQLDNKTVNNYLNILNETGLAGLVKKNQSGSSLLKGVEKIYLDNPNLYQVIGDEIGLSYKKGTVREIFFIKMLKNAGEKVFYSNIGDFTVRRINFEIGGKNKTKKQLKKNQKSSFLVKDDILFPHGNTLPLYLFGFLY